MGAHKKSVEFHFSEMAEGYDRWFNSPLGQYVGNSERETVISLLKPSPGELILDIGTGTGIYLMEIAKYGATVVGLDISIRMLKILSKKLGEDGEQVRISLVLADAENLPFREQTFHKILNNTTLEFLPSPERALSEAHRTLISGGSLIIGVLASTSLWALERRLRRVQAENVYSYAKFYSLRKLRSLLKVSGFAVKEAKWSVYAPRGTPAKFIPLFEWLEGKLNALPIIKSIGAFLVVKAVSQS